MRRRVCPILPVLGAITRRKEVSGLPVSLGREVVTRRRVLSSHPEINVDNEARSVPILWEKRGKREEGMLRKVLSFLPAFGPFSAHYSPFCQEC